MSGKISMKKLAKQVGAGGKVIIIPAGHMKHMGMGGVVSDAKRKRPATAYNKFVKDNMPDVKARITNPKERFAELGRMWKAQKGL